MADATDTANVIIRPPIAWGVAVLVGLALNWRLPLRFIPAAIPAGGLGAMVFALALGLVLWAILLLGGGATLILQFSLIETHARIVIE